MKILVCGGRDFDNYGLLEEKLNYIYWNPYDWDNSIEWETNEDMEIISGMAKGADSLAARYAQEYGHILHKFPADWKTHGKAAGPIRNQQMIDEGKPDLVVAFPGGNGTADMVRRAKKHGIEVVEVKYD